MEESVVKFLNGPKSTYPENLNPHPQSGYCICTIAAGRDADRRRARGAARPPRAA
eukprot:COSAG02_NODE_29356_length_570_cov_17.159236_1_plen_54_part_01